MNEITLAKDEMPDSFYNILADLPKPLEMPQGNLDVLPKIFAPSLLKQEFSQERFLKIPDEILELYSLVGRPTPLYRAKRLEEKLKTPAKIYFKREDSTVNGSHKINTALAQAYYIAKDGIQNVTTETGAGQWGSALSIACNFFGVKAKVFMVKCSFEQKPYRKYVMKLYNAEVIPSPSNLTEAGRTVLKEDPNHAGSLGIAISEAIETALNSESTVYCLGSVLNHVLMHQTVIGQEAKKQLESIDAKPDVVIGCVGGGSNFAGLAFPFLREQFQKKLDAEFIAVEPVEVPSITKGEFDFDYGDEAELTPLLKMYTLGHKFKASPIYAGGLRYHGMAPLISHLVSLGFIKAQAFGQIECFEAAKLFAETEGIIPAPESSHAIKATIEKALECKKTGEEKTILFNLSGHGLLDLQGYASVFKY